MTQTSKKLEAIYLRQRIQKGIEHPESADDEDLAAAAKLALEWIKQEQDETYRKLACEVVHHLLGGIGSRCRWRQGAFQTAQTHLGQLEQIEAWRVEQERKDLDQEEATQ